MDALPPSAGWFSRRAALALGRERRRRNRFLGLILFGLFRLAVTALLTLSHGLSPVLPAPEIVSVAGRVVEKMVEVRQHSVDEPEPA